MSQQEVMLQGPENCLPSVQMSTSGEYPHPLWLLWYSTLRLLGSFSQVDPVSCKTFGLVLVLGKL